MVPIFGPPCGCNKRLQRLRQMFNIHVCYFCRRLLFTHVPNFTLKKCRLSLGPVN